MSTPAATRLPGQGLADLVERTRARHIPLEVLFEVTHRCNLPCQHCYLPDHGDHGELTLAEIAGVFDQLASAGTVFLTFTGGEVLSRRDFLDILDLAHARGFVLKILSNATLVTDAVAAHFARVGVLEVSVSLYGTDPAVHDAVTEMPGSYERTMAGIARLRAHGVHVVLKTPVLAMNGASAASVHELAMLQNMPCRFDISITPKNNGDPGPMALALHHKQMVELMTQEPFADYFARRNAEDVSAPEPCNAGRGYCSISPTGDLQPCIMMPEVLGNLRTQRFADVWGAHPFLGKLRGLTSADLHECTSCEVSGACARCPGIAMHRGRGVDGCDLNARQIAKARVQARHRLNIVP